MAPDLLTPRPILAGLNTRSVGPNWPLLGSAGSSRTRSLAALLSLLRSRMPFALGSRRKEPDQLLPLDPDSVDT